MNTPQSALLRALILLIIVLAGLLVAAGAVGLARYEGAPWPRAFKQGAAGFGAACTLMIAVYATFVLLPE